MKKTLFLTALFAVLMLSCTNDEGLHSEDKSSTPSKIKVVNYNYQGKNYSARIDISDEENFILLEGKDNEFLSEIYENQEQLTTVYVNESMFYLFDNTAAYEKSALYVENENKAAAFRKSIETKNESTASETTSLLPDITAPLPKKYKNYNVQAYLYRRSQFRFDDGGYYVTLGQYGTLDIPDFRYLKNSSSTFGGYGGSLFPYSAFNEAQTTNQSKSHNDAISSIYVNFMVVTIYEHQNYKGQSAVYDGRGLRAMTRDLNDKLYDCNIFSCRSWNDKISSAKFRL